MGYKNDQFFNSGDSAKINDVNTSGRSIRASNPSFEDDPRNIIRFMEKDRNGTWAPQQVKLKRGYIRSLLSTVQTGVLSSDDNVPIVKCNFQFNPQYINHRVPMRTNLTNMFLQNAAQFSQPVAGDVSFAFELTFDRSYLLNNEHTNSDSESQGTPDEKQIGVLADLRALYEVIGQGISDKMVKYQQNRAIQQAQTELQTEQIATGQGTTTTTTDADGKVTTTTTVDSKGTLLTAEAIAAGEGVQTIFDPTVNKGNNAFLIPMPVRVVFSSLFMVDGYVTETDVTYTKFTSSLVPIQCRVGLSMQAMYVGFAKKQTFLTVNLDNAADAIRRTQKELAQNAIETNNTVNANLTKISVSPKETVVATKNIQYRGGADPTSSGKFTMKFTRLINLLTQSNDANMKQVISYLKDAPSDYLASAAATRYLNVDIQKDEGDKIRKLFDGTAPPTITMDIRVKTYGPFDTSQLANAAKDIFEAQNINPSTLVPPDPALTQLASKLISESTLSTNEITTGDDWDKFREGSDMPAQILFTNAGYNATALEENKNKYFVVSCTVRATVTTSTLGAVPVQFKTQAVVLDLNSEIIAFSTRDFINPSTTFTVTI